MPLRLRKHLHTILADLELAGNKFLSGKSKNRDFAKFDYDEKEKQIGNGLFIVGESKDSFYVITGNLVRNEKMATLESRLEKLNTSSSKDLKHLFLKQMIEGELNEKGGAGLGLIDIARKSGKKLYYHFVPYDSQRYFFILGVTIPVIAEEDESDED